MRIWDINPGYLNRQSLLGEHRELHGIVSILWQKKKGYARHPETLRWAGFGWALRQRHNLLAAEMALRGYTDRSPVMTRSRKDQWPDVHIDAPHRQFHILATKYRDREQGRIPLPASAQMLWRHHKYSVLARDQGLYKTLGPQVATAKPSDDFSALADQLADILKTRPPAGGIRNALQHMWGHVSDYPSGANGKVESWSSGRLLNEIQRRALESDDMYLTKSTALSELMVWIPNV